MHTETVTYCTECQFNSSCSIRKTMTICANLAKLNESKLFCAIGRPKDFKEETNAP